MFEHLSWPELVLNLSGYIYLRLRCRDTVDSSRWLRAMDVSRSCNPSSNQREVERKQKKEGEGHKQNL